MLRVGAGVLITLGGVGALCNGGWADELAIGGIEVILGGEL